MNIIDEYQINYAVGIRFAYNVLVTTKSRKPRLLKIQVTRRNCYYCEKMPYSVTSLPQYSITRG